MEINIGDVFGRLTVLKILSMEEWPKRYVVQCNCPNKTILTTTKQAIKDGKDNCGCLRNIKQSETKAKKFMNKYNLEGNFGIGYTPRMEEFYFDKEDYEKIKNFRWNIKDRTQPTKYLFATKRLEKKTIAMHRLILDAKEGEIVDHINHNTLDNRKINLRIVTAQQNSFNCQDTKGRCLPKGIYQTRNGKYIVRICINGKRINLGTYESVEEASSVREDADIKYYKDYRYIRGI